MSPSSASRHNSHNISSPQPFMYNDPVNMPRRDSSRTRPNRRRRVPSHHHQQPTNISHLNNIQPVVTPPPMDGQAMRLVTRWSATSALGVQPYPLARHISHNESDNNRSMSLNRGNVSRTSHSRKTSQKRNTSSHHTPAYHHNISHLNGIDNDINPHDTARSSTWSYTPSLGLVPLPLARPHRRPSVPHEVYHYDADGNLKSHVTHNTAGNKHNTGPPMASTVAAGGMFGSSLLKDDNAKNDMFRSSELRLNSDQESDMLRSTKVLSSYSGSVDSTNTSQETKGAGQGAIRVSLDSLGADSESFDVSKTVHSEKRTVKFAGISSSSSSAASSDKAPVNITSDGQQFQTLMSRLNPFNDDATKLDDGTDNAVEVDQLQDEKTAQKSSKPFVDHFANLSPLDIPPLKAIQAAIIRNNNTLPPVPVSSGISNTGGMTCCPRQTEAVSSTAVMDRLVDFDASKVIATTGAPKNRVKSKLQIGKDLVETNYVGTRWVLGGVSEPKYKTGELDANGRVVEPDYDPEGDGKRFPGCKVSTYYSRRRNEDCPALEIMAKSAVGSIGKAGDTTVSKQVLPREGGDIITQTQQVLMDPKSGVQYTVFDGYTGTAKQLNENGGFVTPANCVTSTEGALPYISQGLPTHNMMTVDEVKSLGPLIRCMKCNGLNKPTSLGWHVCKCEHTAEDRLRYAALGEGGVVCESCDNFDEASLRKVGWTLKRREVTHIVNNDFPSVSSTTTKTTSFSIMVPANNSTGFVEVPVSFCNCTSLEIAARGSTASTSTGGTSTTATPRRASLPITFGEPRLVVATEGENKSLLIREIVMSGTGDDTAEAKHGLPSLLSSTPLSKPDMFNDTIRLSAGIPRVVDVGEERILELMTLENKWDAFTDKDTALEAALHPTQRAALHVEVGDAKKLQNKRRTPKYIRAKNPFLRLDDESKFVLDEDRNHRGYLMTPLKDVEESKGGWWRKLFGVGGTQPDTNKAASLVDPLSGHKYVRRGENQAIDIQTQTIYQLKQVAPGAKAGFGIHVAPELENKAGLWGCPTGVIPENTNMTTGVNGEVPQDTNMTSTTASGRQGKVMGEAEVYEEMRGTTFYNHTPNKVCQNGRKFQIHPDGYFDKLDDDTCRGSSMMSASTVSSTGVPSSESSFYSTDNDVSSGSGTYSTSTGAVPVVGGTTRVALDKQTGKRFVVQELDRAVHSHADFGKAAEFLHDTGMSKSVVGSIPLDTRLTNRKFIFDTLGTSWTNPARRDRHNIDAEETYGGMLPDICERRRRLSSRRISVTTMTTSTRVADTTQRGRDTTSASRYRTTSTAVTTKSQTTNKQHTSYRSGSTSRGRAGATGSTRRTTKTEGGTSMSVYGASDWHKAINSGRGKQANKSKMSKCVDWLCCNRNPSIVTDDTSRGGPSLYTAVSSSGQRGTSTQSSNLTSSQFSTGTQSSSESNSNQYASTASVSGVSSSVSGDNTSGNTHADGTEGLLCSVDPTSGQPIVVATGTLHPVGPMHMSHIGYAHVPPATTGVNDQ